MMQPDFWYSLPVLTGRQVRLAPLSLEHAAGYLAAIGTGPAAERAIRWVSPDGPPRTVAEAVREVAGALAARSRGERLPYAVLDATSGTFAGSVSFCRLDPARRALAIDHRWLGPSWTGAGRGAETALLLLTYAFDALGAVRVELPVAAADTAVRAELGSLGIALEGTLRNHRPDGRGGFTDTALYALTDADWPGVRAALS